MMAQIIMITKFIKKDLVSNTRYLIKPIAIFLLISCQINKRPADISLNNYGPHRLPDEYESKNVQHE